MPAVYRICKTKYAATAFDGEGAFRFGGRWNTRGTRLIYTAGNLALAALEMLVHLDEYPRPISNIAERSPSLIPPLQFVRQCLTNSAGCHLPRLPTQA